MMTPAQRTVGQICCRTIFLNALKVFTDIAITLHHGQKYSLISEFIWQTNTYFFHLKSKLWPKDMEIGQPCLKKRLCDPVCVFLNSFLSEDFAHFRWHTLDSEGWNLSREPCLVFQIRHNCAGNQHSRASGKETVQSVRSGEKERANLLQSGSEEWRKAARRLTSSVLFQCFAWQSLSYCRTANRSTPGEANTCLRASNRITTHKHRQTSLSWVALASGHGVWMWGRKCREFEMVQPHSGQCFCLDSQ